MAKRKAARRSPRQGRQAAGAKPRARKRARPASSARSTSAGTRKTAARAKAGARGAKRGAKASGAKTPGRRTAQSTAVRAVVGRKATRPAGKAKARTAKTAKVAKTVRPVKVTKASTAKARNAKAGNAGNSAVKVRPVSTPVARARTSSTRKAVAVAARPARPVLGTVAPEALRRKRAPDLDRERRRVQDDDAVISPTPPSSLGLDRSASAARSGRQELRDRYDQHTETGPALTAGDIDADWESAYSVGDEAPGGDNPTPDQNVVDDIGAAVGVAYDDNEELEGADRIEERDRHRWEFDPASSDDFDDR